MDADVTAILAAIDIVSKKVDSTVGSAKDELKEDIQELREDIQNVQKTVDKHTSSLKHIVRVVAGPMPVAINNIEEKLKTAKTDFPLRAVPAEISS